MLLLFGDRSMSGEGAFFNGYPVCISGRSGIPHEPGFYRIDEFTPGALPSSTIEKNCIRIQERRWLAFRNRPRSLGASWRCPRVIRAPSRRLPTSIHGV